VPFGRAKYRAQRKRFLRRNFALVWFLVSCTVLFCALLSLVLDGYLLGLLQGVALTLLAAALNSLFHAVSGALGPLAGAWGEDNTSDVLRRARRRGHIWGWIDGVATDSGDVDHVVVTKLGGVVAIDSKWHAGLWGETLGRDLVAASTAARRARLILLSYGRRQPVTPVVVVWGGAQEDLQEAEHRGDNVVVAGRDLGGWLSNLHGEAIDRSTGLQMLAEFREHKRRVKPTRNLSRAHVKPRGVRSFSATP
jgi:hypothetical protein